MDIISKLNSLIDKELDEFKLVLLEKSEYQIKPYVDELAKKANCVNKSELVHMEPFKIFLIFFYFTNNNIMSFDEAYKMVLEIRKEINQWSFANQRNTLLDLAKALNTSNGGLNNKAIECMNKLGLTPEFINFNLVNVSVIMASFLKLKRDITEINIKEKNLIIKNKLMKQIYNKSQLKACIELVVNGVKEAEERVNYRHEIAKEKIKYTKEVQAKVEDLSILELDEMPKDWHIYLELELLEQIYNIIFDNLAKKDEMVQGEIKKQEGIINRTPLVKYLYSNGIDVNSIDSKLLNSLEKLSLKENIQYILDFLKSLGLSLNRILSEYSDVLLSLTDDKVNKIKFLLSANVLRKETLVNNLKMFEIKYNELLTNYDILKPVMDFNSMFYDDSILFKTPIVIKNILSVLGEYDLTKNNYIYLVCHFNYLNIYDLLLENNIPLYLFISICETDNPLQTIKRILVYREIGEEFETSNKLLRKEVRSSDKSFMRDEDLDDYLALLPDLTRIEGNKISKVKDSSVVKEFDSQYRVSHDTYMIGNFLVSRAKFLRNFETMKESNDSIIVCLVSDSLLNERDFLGLVKELKGKRL